MTYSFASQILSHLLTFLSSHSTSLYVCSTLIIGIIMVIRDSLEVIDESFQIVSILCSLLYVL